MKCKRFRKLLIPYSEGSVSPPLSESLEQHLAECEECARELRSLTCTADVLRKIDYPAFEPAADLRNRVLAQIAEDRPVRRLWWQPAGLQAYSAAVAGLLLVAVAGAGMWQMMARNVEAPAGSAMVQRQAETPTDQLLKVAPTEQATAEAVTPSRPAAKKPVPAAQAPRTSDSVRWFFDATIADEHGSSAGRYARSAVPSRPASAYLYSSADTDALSRLHSPAASLPEALADTEKMGLGYGSMTAARQTPPVPEASDCVTRGVNQSDLGGTQTKRFGEDAVAGAPGQPGPTIRAGVPLESIAKADARGKAAYSDDKRLFGPSLTADVGNRMVDTGNSYSIAGGLVQSDISGLETKLRDFPSSVNVITDLMVRYRQAGRPRDEYNMAQRLTKLDPDNAGYWLSRAQAADRVPMRKTAEVCYERAIKLGLKGAQLEQARTRAKALESSSK